MKNAIKLFAGVTLAAIAATACASEPAESGQAPDVADGRTDTLDEGDSYGGWTQSGFVFVDLWQYSNNYIYHQLSRSYGDSTRGGGGCLVRATTTSCSVDSTCVSLATSTYGTGAYGYCFQGSCYSRPGANTTYCTVPNGNRSPGFLTRTLSASDVSTFSEAMLGCMTKAAGPSMACGCSGDNCGSGYMRQVFNAWYDTGPIY